MEDWKQRKVLIIDDDAQIREMYVHKLKAEGYTVIEGNDGASALPLAMAEKPDIILLDVMMTQMSGFVMMKHLRADPEWGAKVPVIFLTNVDPHDDAAKYMVSSTEPVNYLVKSRTSPEELYKAVRTTIGWGKELTDRA